MKLSILVAVYKVEQYLNQCVDSLLEQNIDDYEIILVDNESPDSCPQICDEYHEKFPDIVKVIHKKHGNLATSRNTGLDNAKGDYLLFFDSDDFFKENRLNEILEKAYEYNADIIQTTYSSYYEDTGKMNTWKPLLPTNRVLTHEDMATEICRITSSRFGMYVWRNLYRRQFLVDNNIRFPEELKTIEDGPFNQQAFSTAQRVACVDIPAYCYRLREGSLQRQFISDYDVVLDQQWKLKMKYYEENFEPKNEFYEDIAKFTLKGQLPLLIRNTYAYERDDKFEVLKRIGNCEMIRRSFKDYDINEYKSKSLDWVATKLIKHKMYILAHIVCKYFWFKK